MSVVSNRLALERLIGGARTTPYLRAKQSGILIALIICATLAPATPDGVRAQEGNLLPPVTVDAPPTNPLRLPSGGRDVAGTMQLGGSPSGSAGGSGDNGHRRCVDVTIGNDTSFGCINERLKRKVDEVNPVLNVPPIDAKSSDLKVGTVNIPAVQQQFGRNFGHSVVPYRPTMAFPSVRH